MTEEELKFIYPNYKHIYIDSKCTAEVYQDLVSKMAKNGDKDIVSIGNFYPMWIIDLCRRANKSIVAFAEEKDIKIFRFLQKELSNPDLQVHLIINNEPEDFTEQKFISDMSNMGRLKIHPQPILAGTSLVIDGTHFLIKQDKTQEKKYFWGAFHQQEIGQKIQNILIERWQKIPQHIASHTIVIKNERQYVK